MGNNVVKKEVDIGIPEEVIEDQILPYLEPRELIIFQAIIH